MSILVLHTIIPHTHENIVSEQTTLRSEVKDLGVFSLLGYLISPDMGEHHLEFFNLNDVDQIEVEFDNELVLFNEAEDVDHEIQNAEIQFDPRYGYKSKVPPNSNPSRGPPSYS